MGFGEFGIVDFGLGIVWKVEGGRWKVDFGVWNADWRWGSIRLLPRVHPIRAPQSQIQNQDGRLSR